MRTRRHGRRRASAVAACHAAAVACLAFSCADADVEPRNTVMPMHTLPPAADGTTDFGIGVIGFRQEWSDTQAADTLTLWREPVNGEPVARFVWAADGAGGWEYRVEQAEPGAAVAGAAIEYDYEIAGLPVEHVDRSAGAARVIYGIDAAGEPRTAWARLHDDLELILWSEHLPAQALFFRSNTDARLFDAPDGRPIPFDLPEWDYQLMPDSVHGDWMRVHASVPHFCTGDPAQREVTAWIRYLDPRGRPTVWYYTRGC